MRKTMIAIAIAMSGFGISAAEAMPIAAAPAGVTNNVQQVDYACGRGYHITRWGECRPNWRRPPPPRYYHGWGHRPPPRYYGWRDDRGYRPPPWRGGGYYRY